MKIEKSVSLAKYTTFGFGGPAKYLFEATTESELRAVLEQAQTEQEQVLILAGGSNVIISSKGFDGYVIRPMFKSIKNIGDRLIVGSGATVAEVLDYAIKLNLAGIEWAGGLPGTIGGAVRGNAGAFGGEFKDIVYEVKSYSPVLKKSLIRSNKDCQFEYRGSYFKYHPEEVITEITLILKPADGKNLRLVADEKIQYRQKFHPIEYGCAGSIFKNIPCQSFSKEKLKLFTDVIKNDPFPVVPVAKVISDAGLSGLKINDAQVSLKHTNYIVNLGSATGEDVFELIKIVQKVVQEKFEIEIEIEPLLVGFKE